MTIPISSRFDYHTVVQPHGDGHWAGISEEGEAESLLGSHPSVVVADGRVTITRRQRSVLRRSRPVSALQRVSASFDGGAALRTVLRQGDRLACWRGGTAEIGLSVSRGGSLALGLGALGGKPGSGVTIEHDPRVEEIELAGRIHYIDRCGARIVWLDPDSPDEFEAKLRELDGDLAGVDVLAIVVRTDDTAVSRAVNRRTMMEPRFDVGATVFVTASARFSSVEEWLAYGRALSTERPRDLWLRVRLGDREQLVAEGTTAMVDDWLVHVHRVYEPGIPGRQSQLGLVPADAGVTPAMLESSTVAMANGPILA